MQRPGVFLLSRTTLYSRPPRHTTFADRCLDSLRSRQNVPRAFFFHLDFLKSFLKKEKKTKNGSTTITNEGGGNT